MKRTLIWICAVIGIIFIALAIYYWVTPADSLATFMPGYDPSLTAVHFKHGLASLIVGLGFLVISWFASGPRRA